MLHAMASRVPISSIIHLNVGAKGKTLNGLMTNMLLYGGLLRMVAIHMQKVDTSGGTGSCPHFRWAGATSFLFSFATMAVTVTYQKLSTQTHRAKTITSQNPFSFEAGKELKGALF